MPNKTIQLDEPALEGQTLTLRMYDGTTLVQNTLATATATTGRFTWTVGAAVTAKEYQVRVYIGSFMAGTYYVYFENGDVEGTYRVYNFSRAEIVEPILNEISLTGTGQYAITFQARVGSTAVPNAKVSIFQGSTLVAAIYTGSNGNVTYNLDAGNYTINVSANGYSPISGQSVAVSAAANVAIAMTAITIPAPSLPELCTVRCQILNSAGTAVQGARVTADLQDDSTVDGALVAQTTVQGDTNSSGYVDLTLIRHTAFTRGGWYKVRVKLPDQKVTFNRLMKVPNVATAFLEDLLDS